MMSVNRFISLLKNRNTFPKQKKSIKSAPKKLPFHKKNLPKLIITQLNKNKPKFACPLTSNQMLHFLCLYSYIHVLLGKFKNEKTKEQTPGTK